MNKISIPLALIFFLAACSEKALYNNIQTNQRYHCMTLPETEREPCLESVAMKYEEYKRQREDLSANQRAQNQ
ncbi:MAG: hypothetical protein KTR16_01910 [Acidiferrobacterales bacterium]|nr:hypothetical protein [Acidiferrobacterales bacterium]